MSSASCDRHLLAARPRRVASAARPVSTSSSARSRRTSRAAAATGSICAYSLDRRTKSSGARSGAAIASASSCFFASIETIRSSEMVFMTLTAPPATLRARGCIVRFDAGASTCAVGHAKHDDFARALLHRPVEPLARRLPVATSSTDKPGRREAAMRQPSAASMRRIILDDDRGVDQLSAPARRSSSPAARSPPPSRPPACAGRRAARSARHSGRRRSPCPARRAGR